MSMDIEVKFTKNIAWLLDELQADMLVSKSDRVNFHYITEEGAPTHREQRRALRWLYKLGAAQFAGDIHPDDFYSKLLAAHPFAKVAAIGETLQIDKQIFTPLRVIFSGDWEKEPAIEILNKAEKLRRAKKVDTTAITQPVLNKVPFWNEELRTIVYLDKSCEVPVGNQRVLCEVLFKTPLGTWVNEDDVIGNFNRDGKTSFYDAQRLLDERIKKALGIANFIEYQTSQARINPATIKKLNHSET